MKKITGYKMLEPGTYMASTGKLVVTDQDVKDYVDAINAKSMLGVPAVAVYDHRKKGETIPVGKLGGAIYRDGKAFVDISLEMNAEFDNKTLATVAQMETGLNNRMLQGSMEARRNYQNPAYTGGRKFGLWPTAWAILPAGTQPAVPPNIAAADGSDTVVWLTLNDAPVGGESPNRKGADEMTLEEMSVKLEEQGKSIDKLVTAMEEVVKGQKVTASDKGDGEKSAEVIAAEKITASAVEAAEEAVVIAKDSMKARKPEGVREKVEAFVAAGETPADKMARIKQIDGLIPDLEVPDGGTLKAGEADPETGEKTNGDKVVAKAKKLAKENKISFNEALEEIRAEEEAD